jgi:hypothetical protein
VFLIYNFSVVSVMDNIIEPNETFDFSKLSLAHPTGIQGGAYFTKIHLNNKPLYIQTTKSLTRQGFVKNGKKYYCDLMFDKNAEALINWFENLEERCQKLIFEKSGSWFQNALVMNDIESAFSSIIRIYKSGKYYLVRTNVKNNASNEPSIKIYDENETALGIDDITNEKEIISILEIQGIKFTSRNFQIEIELKQVMALNNEPIFESCLIKTTKPKPVLENSQSQILGIKNDLGKINNLIELKKEENELELLEEPLDILENKLMDNKESNIKENDVNQSNNIKELNNIKETSDITDFDTENKSLEDNTKFNSLVSNTNVIQNINTNTVNNDLLEIDFTDLLEEPKNDDNLTEMDFDELTKNSLETVTLKKPNQVYFELYKEARNKAKMAKKAVIVAYLEAKNIKKTYMLENLNGSDSDSDFDAEIDEVSESELENF